MYCCTEGSQKGVLNPEVMLVGHRPRRVRQAYPGVKLSDFLPTQALFAPLCLLNTFAVHHVCSVCRRRAILQCKALNPSGRDVAIASSPARLWLAPSATARHRSPRSSLLLLLTCKPSSILAVRLSYTGR